MKNLVQNLSLSEQIESLPLSSLPISSRLISSIIFLPFLVCAESRGGGRDKCVLKHGLRTPLEITKIEKNDETNKTKNNIYNKYSSERAMEKYREKKECIKREVNGYIILKRRAKIALKRAMK